MDELGIPGVPQIGPEELKERLEADGPLALVDVREAFECEIVDLPDHGQVNIPVGDLQARWEELDPETATIVYCRTGNRSAWAVQFLLGKGFREVINLRRGVMGWREDIDPSLPEY